MTDLKNRIPRDRFLPLPRPTKTDGTPCRVGVEIELGGLDEDAAARAESAGLRVVMDRCPKIEIPRLGVEKATELSET